MHLPSRLARSGIQRPPTLLRGRFDTGVVPSFMVVGDDCLRIRCAEETHDFRQRHEAARQARLLREEAVFPYGTYAMRVFHDAEIEPASATDGYTVNAPGVLATDDGKSPVDAEREQALALRGRVAVVKDEEIEDTLSERLEESQAYTVDRSQAHPVHAPESPMATTGGAARPATKLSKLVVTRNASRAAVERRRRTRELQSEHEPASREASPDAGDNPDPDPPPH